MCVSDGVFSSQTKRLKSGERTSTSETMTRDSRRGSRMWGSPGPESMLR